MWSTRRIYLCLSNRKLQRKRVCICMLGVRVFSVLIFLGLFCMETDADISDDCNKMKHEDYNGSFKLIYPARNIHVVPLYDEHLHMIKFNVSWEKPILGPSPREYGVSVDRISENCDVMHFETNLPKENDTHWTVPISNDYVLHPECTYKVEVKSYLNDCFPNPYVNFTVPECVGKICNCKNLSAPNIIKINVVSAESVRVVWNISQPEEVFKEHNVTSIQFRIFLNNLSVLKFRRPITNRDLYKTHREIIHFPGMVYMFYKLRTNLINQFECDGLFHEKNFKGPLPEPHWWWSVALPTMCFIMFMGFVMVVTWKRCSYWCRRKMRPTLHHTIKGRETCRSQNNDGRRSIMSLTMNSNPIYLHSDMDKFEIPYSCVELGKEIGKGAFGHVYMAKVHGMGGANNVMEVALKTHKKMASPTELEEFLLEIKMLKKIGSHPNIVALLGCCTAKQPYCMLMEFVPCGDLLKYLQALREQYERRDKSRFSYPNPGTRERNFVIYETSGSDVSYIIPDTIPTRGRFSSTETEYTVLFTDSPRFPLTPRSAHILECVLDPKELHNFAIQIAKGMEHLEKQQIIHRDLAARNILINESKILKISDFGFSRSGIYVNKNNKKVPLRWLSSEAIRDNLYTSKSDVWAYGIVLWEIGTLGGFPYPAVTDDKVIKFILEGNLMEKPQHCTDELYELMMQCWAFFADERPSFKQIVEHLEGILERKRVVYVDFNVIKAQLPPPYIPTDEKHERLSRSSKSSGSVKYIDFLISETC